MHRLAFIVLVAALTLVPGLREPARGAPGQAALQREARAGEAPQDLDVYVERVMKEFEVPGLALSVVKDGVVVVAKGYGVRRMGEPAPVDARTLFGIASNTKVFTAAALGLLAEEGKIDWDAPVITYLPWFRLSD